MAKRTRWTHSSAFEAKVALVAMAQQYDVHPNQITAWVARLLESVAELFGGGAAEAVSAIDMKVLHAKIGGLMLENDF